MYFPRQLLSESLQYFYPKVRHQILYLTKQPKHIHISIPPVPFSYFNVHGNAVVVRQLLRHSSVHVSIHILLGVLEVFLRLRVSYSENSFVSS
jgi:hypothetical protein